MPLVIEEIRVEAEAYDVALADGGFSVGPTVPGPGRVRIELAGSGDDVDYRALHELLGRRAVRLIPADTPPGLEQVRFMGEPLTPEEIDWLVARRRARGAAREEGRPRRRRPRTEELVDPADLALLREPPAEAPRREVIAQGEIRPANGDRVLIGPVTVTLTCAACGRSEAEIGGDEPLSPSNGRCGDCQRDLVWRCLTCGWEGADLHAVNLHLISTGHAREYIHRAAPGTSASPPAPEPEPVRPAEETPLRQRLRQVCEYL